MTTELPGTLKILWDLRKPPSQFFYVLRKQPIGLSVCTFLFGASVVLFLLYQDHVRLYESIISRTLSKETENTPQSYKGLEAFILSNVQDDVDVQLQKSHFAEEFVAKYANVTDALATSEINIPKGPRAVELQVTHRQTHHALYDTYTDIDSRSPGYLFLPAYLVHDHQDLAETVRIDDPAVVRAINLGRLLGRSLQQLANGPILALDNNSVDVQAYLQLAPVQVYLITTDGTMRVFNRAAEHPSVEYGNQFPPTTFFPSRPYFWSAVEEYLTAPKPTTSEDIGKSFRVSKPYLDLGGGGVVITLSRPIQVAGVLAVLCIDLQFDSTTQRNIYANLTRNIQLIGGTAATLTCTMDPSNRLKCPSMVDATDRRDQVAEEVRSSLQGDQHSGGMVKGVGESVYF